MKIVSSKYNLIRNNDPLTITMGNFDGLHLGHQQLIERVLTYDDTKHAVITFDPHPSSVLRKQIFRTLTQKEDKIELFSKYPLDYALIIEFDKEFSELNVEQFIEFLRNLTVVRIVIGRDTRFAYRGEGKISHLKRYFYVDIIDDLLYNRTRVSTTYIKDFLAIGDLGSARKLLNRHYNIHGIVVQGNKIGHKLGFPTANIDYGTYYLPRSGVYYTKVYLDNVWYHAMANIGNNPTINYSFEKRLEIHILDFNQDIYGKKVDIVFMHYIRQEFKFKNKKQLIIQLKKDEETIRKLTI